MPRSWGLLVLAGCSGGAAPAPSFATQTPSPTPDASVVATEMPAWTIELVESGTSQIGPLELAVSARPALRIAGTFAGIAAGHVLVDRTTRWETESSVVGFMLAMTSDASGSPWTVHARDTELVLSHGGTAERIAKIEYDYDARAALAFDRAGTPHLCLVTDNSDTDAGPAKGTTRYATKSASGWVVEPVPGSSRHCTIAVPADGRVVIGTEQGVAVRTGPTWTEHALGGETRVTTTPAGLVAVVERGRGLALASEAQGSWTSRPLLVDAGGDVLRSAIAVDATEQLHVVYERDRGQGQSDVWYLAPGAVTPSKVSDEDARIGLAIAVDPAGAPHIVFSPMLSPQHNQRVLHARPYRAGDPQTIVPRRVGDYIAGCGMFIESVIGLEPGDDPRMQRAFADCTDEAYRDVTTETVEQDCAAGHAYACLLRAAWAGKPARTFLDVYELDKGNERIEVGEAEVFGPETVDTKAHDYLAKACAAGSAPACFQLAFITKTSTLPQCSRSLPMACALAVKGATKAELTTIRSTLAEACRMATRPTACHMLAYLEETGLGGKKSVKEAKQHYQRACALDGAGACVRLVAMGGKRAADMDEDHFRDLLASRGVKPKR